MSKVYSSNSTLNEKILKGVDTLADNVAATLGPKGRNVILKTKEGNPVITKDGVTVAKFVELDDPFENLGAQVIKQASENGWDFETELIRLLAHGCSHIAGWDHEGSKKQESEMLELEIQLLKGVGLKNIY